MSDTPIYTMTDEAVCFDGKEIAKVIDNSIIINKNLKVHKPYIEDLLLAADESPLNYNIVSKQVYAKNTEVSTNPTYKSTDDDKLSDMDYALKYDLDIFTSKLEGGKNFVGPYKMTIMEVKEWGRHRCPGRLLFLQEHRPVILCKTVGIINNVQERTDDIETALKVERQKQIPLDPSYNPFSDTNPASAAGGSAAQVTNSGSLMKNKVNGFAIARETEMVYAAKVNSILSKKVNSQESTEFNL